MKDRVPSAVKKYWSAIMKKLYRMCSILNNKSSVTVIVDNLLKTISLCYSQAMRDVTGQMMSN